MRQSPLLHIGIRYLQYALAAAIFFIPTVVSAQNFQVSVRASKSVVEPEQTFVYSVEVRNLGPATTEETDVVLAIDDDLEVVSVSSDGRRSGDSVQWRDLSFGAGTVRTFTASVRVDDGAADGDRLYATAVAGGGYAETVIEVQNDEDENNDNERIVTLELFSNKGQVEPGETMSFIVKARNQTDRKISDITIIAELAEGLEFLSASNRGRGSGNGVEWSDIDLSKNEERTFTASVRVSDEVQHGDSLTSSVYAEGFVQEHRISVWDPDYGKEDMRLHAFAETDSVEPGGSLTYTLRVRNLDNDDQKVDVLAYIDPRTRLESASDDGQQFDRTLVVWEHAALQQNETKTFTLTVHVNEDAIPGTPLRFSAQSGLGRQEVVTEIVPAATVENAENTEAEERAFFGRTNNEEGEQRTVQSNRWSIFSQEEDTPNEQRQDIHLVVEAGGDKQEAQPGSFLTFLVRVRNDGTTTAENLIVEDHFPANTLTVRDAGGGRTTDNSVNWTIARLAPGEVWNAEYRAQLLTSLEHGESIQRETIVRSNTETVATAMSRTNVIEDLPQAGLHSFVLGFEQMRAQLQPAKSLAAEPKHSSPAIAAEPVRESAGIPRVLWILLVGTGLLAGSWLAWKHA